MKIDEKKYGECASQKVKKMGHEYLGERELRSLYEELTDLMDKTTAPVTLARKQG